MKIHEARRLFEERLIMKVFIGFAFVGLMICTSACGLLESPDTTPPPSSPTAAAMPPQQMTICIDRSTSYRFTAQALEAVSNMLPQLVNPGGGWTIDIRWVQENSFLPEAHLATITIPAIPFPPSASATPTPEDNPFARREKERQADQQEQQQVDAYLAVVAYQQDISKIREQVQEQADRLKGVTWQPAQGSDLWGCIEKGSELMPTSEGRWLLIASDLEEFGAQQKAAPDLTGARVQIVFFQIDEAAKNVQIQAAWRQSLGEAGAVDVQFHDPVEGISPVLKELGGP